MHESRDKHTTPFVPEDNIFERSIFPVGLRNRIEKAAITGFGLIWLWTTLTKLENINGSSMEPTFSDGSKAIGINLFSLGRFDIVTIKPPFEVEDTFVKRLVGLPGEHVEISSSGLFINGVPEALPAGLDWKIEPPFSRCFTLGAGQYFVMGDNFHDSCDSLDFGPISKSAIIRKILEFPSL